MPRHAIEIECTAEELSQLKIWSNGRRTAKRLVERARIILLCDEGERNDNIAIKLAISKLTVAKWRKRFHQNRLAGLADRARSGKPKRYDETTRNAVLRLLEQTPPVGQANWDGGSIARKLNISDDAVWRILRKEGIQLQRMRSWCVSTDKEFAVKAADIIGLYLNPPEKALILSIDEKPSIQALERKKGYVQTSSKKIVNGLKSTYKRNGTLNLFAALDIATGYVKTKTTATKKRLDFRSFLAEVLEDIPTETQVHIILDNYCTHKRNEDWLKKYPNVHFHFTPTSASWLNQVEIWFGILTRKALCGGSFSTLEKLRKAIEDFVEVYHKNAKPFVWRKREVKGAQLRNTIVNLCN